MNIFYNFHPAVSAVYFASVLLITMFSGNPFLAAVSLLGGALFYAVSEKKRRRLKEIGFYLLIFIVIAASNPLFSHKGKTVLFFMGSNPITLESFLYGIGTALMLISVILWFSCLNRVLTEDKILFLFGRFSPKIALLISNSLRFIPLLKNQGEKIRAAQKAMGLYSSDSIADKLRGLLRTFSALVSWSLENAVDTAASMKARGYGLKNRSRYAPYKFKKRDALLLCIIIIADLICAFSIIAHQLDFVFYPTVSFSPLNFINFTAVADFALLCLLPFIIEIKEVLVWKYYASKI